MDIYKIKIHDFEGPLDLLMHLIDKNKIDIYNIPVTEITEQYISYLTGMREFNIDIASDFLVMAATLLQIKSRLLLPKPVIETEEDIDPRQMLIEMLLEYKRVKARAALLVESLKEAQRYHQRKPLAFADLKKTIKPFEFSLLIKALQDLLTIEEVEIAVVERQHFNVQDKMQGILKLLQQKSCYEFRPMISESMGKSELIASFLAILELLRLNQIRIQQSNAFANILVFLKEEKTDVL